ncbi:hypothetical protein ACLOJK_008056 [Asimina triloba]
MKRKADPKSDRLKIRFLRSLATEKEKQIRKSEILQTLTPPGDLLESLAKMVLLAAARDYVGRMLQDISGMKVLILDPQTVRFPLPSGPTPELDLAFSAAGSVTHRSYLGSLYPDSIPLN